MTVLMRVLQVADDNNVITFRRFAIPWAPRAASHARMGIVYRQMWAPDGGLPNALVG